MIVYGSGNTGPKSNIHLNIDNAETWPDQHAKASKSQPKYDPQSSRCTRAQFDKFLNNVNPT
jgi:hypothetical protein